MDFLNIKFLISAGVVIAIALGGAGLEIWRLNGALSSAKAEAQDLKDKLEKEQTKLALKEAESQIYAANLSECNSKISAQNEAIKSITLDMKKIRQSQAGIRKELQAKYESMEPPPRDSSCEENLAYYERLFKGLGK
nr:MAG TPA: Type II secretion system, protein M [Caudoviricetes sp.]